jgi:hypothetical protein
VKKATERKKEKERDRHGRDLKCVFYHYILLVPSNADYILVQLPASSYF